MNLYYIQSEQTLTSTMSINQDTAVSLGIKNNQKIHLSYGKRKHQVLVIISKLTDQNTLQISEQVIQKLLIDSKVKYEVAFKNAELIIGPVIGLLLGRSEAKLTKNMDRFLIYTMIYEQINGVLFVFSEEEIDFLREQITGYVYDPHSANQWRKVELPFPGAIFRRVELSKKTLAGLINIMGRSFFNSYYFDKWQFWNLLSPYKELRDHLPETTNNVNIQQLDHFIGKYNGVYLKPKNGSRGYGIHYIEKKDNQYVVIKNYDNEVKYMSKDEMSKYISKHKYYLLQQPIRLHTFEDRKVDYRVILQKSETGFWPCTGIIARFGKTNAISSNFKASGFAKEGADALKLQFGYDDLKAFQKYQEIIHVCKNIVAKLDQVGEGAYADLGIDIGIDQDEKIWVIEMNKRPDHDFPLIIKDKKMYYMVKTNPVFFAKSVAMGSND
ncbi:YheC/YheD family protein [Lederbergia citrea]|uniref:YheC/YheD family protein n=1 Tax=Lederbergia citrea TaxID=2833581 RepID=A0A942Z473_9BACI|nr:YheC/YheD family protein [Lederbergia citrea]MBS4222090.1 YheC/YheD family protein [Lederbergia citrea]